MWVIIEKQPDAADLWNLKVGGIYQVEQARAETLIAGGYAKPIETAMRPAPGVSKRVRTSDGGGKVANKPSRNKEPRSRD